MNTKKISQPENFNTEEMKETIRMQSVSTCSQRFEKTVDDCQKLTKKFVNFQNQSKAGVVSANIIKDMLTKISTCFDEFGTKIESLARESCKELSVSNSFSSSSNDKIINAVNFFMELGNCYKTLGGEIYYEIVTPLKKNTSKFSEDIKIVTKSHNQDKLDLKRAKIESQNIKTKALKMISLNYERNQSEKKKNILHRLKSTRKNTSTTELLRDYNIKSTKYNQLRNDYYYKKLPSYIKYFEKIEKTRIKLLKNAFNTFPLLYEKTTSELKTTMNIRIVENINTIDEESSFNNFQEIDSNEPSQSKQSKRKSIEVFEVINETYIDKDKEILKLKISNNDIFEISLGELLEFPENEGYNVPLVIFNLCNFIEANGILEEGIFRISASTKDVIRLKQTIQTNGFNIPEQTDVHAAACLLKQFLQQLPLPVITPAVANSFIKIGGMVNNSDFDKNEAINFINEKLQKMPVSNKDTLIYLLKFLNLVVEKKEKNKMSSENLGIIFAPTLFPDNQGDIQDISHDLSCSRNFVKFLLENFNELK